jgi:hypothetical protein
MTKVRSIQQQQKICHLHLLFFLSKKTACYLQQQLLPHICPPISQALSGVRLPLAQQLRLVIVIVIPLLLQRLLFSTMSFSSSHSTPCCPKSNESSYNFFWGIERRPSKHRAFHSLHQNDLHCPTTGLVFHQKL